MSRACLTASGARSALRRSRLNMPGRRAVDLAVVEAELSTIARVRANSYREMGLLSYQDSPAVRCCQARQLAPFAFAQWWKNSSN